ncbi:hypothetical protein K474DRAFT_617729 [Panus rudis PR-1116 ss-1]|nr:hypothetical protein K474DRAFT_617729 [Panus rudis PR-1116 ss-1]
MSLEPPLGIRNLRPQSPSSSHCPPAPSIMSSVSPPPSRSRSPESSHPLELNSVTPAPSPAVIDTPREAVCHVPVIEGSDSSFIIPPPSPAPQDSYSSLRMAIPPHIVVSSRRRSPDLNSEYSSMKKRGSHVEEHEVKQLNTENTKQKKEKERSWVVEFMHFQDALFMEAEQERRFKHSQNIENWENMFRSAEERRNGHMRGRKTLFEERQEELEENIFKLTLHRFEQQFERKEEARQLAEKQRVNEFSAELEYCQEVFERAQAWYRSEHNAASQNEKAYMRCHEVGVQRLIVEMTNALERLRSYLEEIFTTEMKTYKQHLRSVEPPPPQMTQPQRMIVLRPSMASLRSRSTIISPPPNHYVRRSAVCRATASAWSDSPVHLSHIVQHSRRSRSPSRSWRQRYHVEPAAEAGFVPQTLFQSNRITKLPIPRDHTDANKSGQLTKSLTGAVGNGTRFAYIDHLKRQKNTYERAAAQRGNEVESLRQKLQEEFAINDAQRQLEFLETHQSMQHSAAARERGQAQTFNELLRSQESSFEAREKQRANAFLTSEREREEEFRRSQKTRDEEFHRSQLALLKEAHEEESKREEELSTWRVRVERNIRQKQREWKETFERDKEKRREMFEKLLSAS